MKYPARPNFVLCLWLLVTVPFAGACRDATTRAERDSRAVDCVAREAKHYPPLEAVAADTLKGLSTSQFTEVSHCEDTQVEALGQIETTVRSWTSTAEGVRYLEGLGWDAEADPPGLTSPDESILVYIRGSREGGEAVATATFVLADERKKLLTE